ncbi:MAG: CBS domain-containing protein [Candidatus Methanomethylophilaceae archaeon]|jgi:CBS domain-containing protein
MVIKDLEDPRRLSMLRSQIDAYSVEEIMDSDFPTVGSDDRLSDVLSVMRDTNYQDVPVVDNGTYMGVISYTTILKKKSANMDSKVKGLLRGVPMLSKSDDITKIAEEMTSNNCKQLPVISGKKIIGVVSRRALVDIASKVKVLNDIKVWEIMTNPVKSVGVNAMLSDAFEMMQELDTLTIPIVDSENKVVGVVGMREIIDNNWRNDNKIIGDLEKNAKAQITVESVSVSPAITVNWDDTVEDAAALMVDNDISTLPVVEGEKLVGMLTQYDIIEIISACRERELMFIQISGLEDDDKAATEALYEVIEEQMVKISKVYRPESLMLHVARYNDTGGSAKYSISARLYMRGKVVNYKEVGWDLVRTTSDLMKKISESVMSMKDSKIKFRQRKK